MLFGEETWVVTLQIGHLLGSFCHRAARSMVGMQTQRQVDGSCYYPLLEDVLQVLVLEYMETDRVQASLRNKIYE